MRYGSAGFCKIGCILRNNCGVVCPDLFDSRSVNLVTDSVEKPNNSSRMPALLAEVATHPFLRDLSPDHLELLARNAMKVHFNSGALIFREGDPANRFYLLKNGKIVLESDGETGRTLIQVIGAGD